MKRTLLTALAASALLAALAVEAPAPAAAATVALTDGATVQDVYWHRHWRRHYYHRHWRRYYGLNAAPVDRA